MRLSASGEAFLAEARGRILWALETRGPLRTGELPRSWPVTRLLLRHLVEELLEEGAVEVTPDARIRLRDGAGESA